MRGYGTDMATPIGPGFGKWLGLFSLLGLVLTLALTAASGTLARHHVPSLVVMAISGSFFFASLGLFLADVPRGFISALRGMIVGGGSLALWLGWDSGWTTGQWSTGLAILGAVAGFLSGAFFGGMAGVILGWLLRAAFGPHARLKPASASEAAGLHDPWVDGLID